MNKCSKCGLTEKAFAILSQKIITETERAPLKFGRTALIPTYELDFYVRIMCTNCGNIEDKHITKVLTKKELNNLCKEVVYDTEMYD